jgi:LPS-assembly protein
MKSNLILIICVIFFNTFLYAENILIESKNVILDKNKETSIFENEVVIKIENEQTISSEYAEYNKIKGFIKLKNNITAVDDRDNLIKSNFATYNERTKIFKSIGPTEIITSEKYLINGTDITLDNNKKFISSKEDAVITDQDNNKIYLENFEYDSEINIFKSIGLIKIIDKNNNKYEFSQIYIDTKKKEILGTDLKSFFNNKNFKINEENKPRIFANTLKLNRDTSIYNKSVFTLCNYRKDDKCPPWTIQASEMLHDNKKKTIYYKNAVIKVYNIPIFYIPKLSHPDPTVDRRSGFLPPMMQSSKNLGTGLSVPYFWAIDDDKNFTFTNRFFNTENPLFMGAYHQAFENSSLITDFGYTEGYKKTSSKKKSGDKSHFFSNFTKNFKLSENSESSFSLITQDVSNDKYLKLYKLESELVDYSTSTLENSLNFIHDDEDFFLSVNASAFKSLNQSSKRKDDYEYILPEITFDKNLISGSSFGNLDLQTNFKGNNYDTNKSTNFLVNDFNWNSVELNTKSGIKSKFLGHLKNVNYESKNVNLYKKDTTNELFGALGYLSEINFYKKRGSSDHFLKPKMLIRYAPGEMRQEKDNMGVLNPNKAFNIDRIGNINNFETGLNTTIGFDYEIKKDNKNFDFSIAQIINEKENKKMHSKTSLDEKLSDVVGLANYDMGDKVKLGYKFSLDQNYNELNYSEIGTKLNFDPFKINFNYLKENKHIGDQEYFKTKIDFAKNKKGLLSIETKRNLVTNSAEFYNLSYEYINDCLRAGLVYRREFYDDSELEPENSIMFKITLTPFGDINSPSFAQ